MLILECVIYVLLAWMVFLTTYACVFKILQRIDGMDYDAGLVVRLPALAALSIIYYLGFGG
jgi:hypothetical protein